MEFETHLPVAAPIDTESAANGGVVAKQGVLRVRCLQTNSAGTGFLHQSGKIITAEHVIRGCSDVILVLPDQVQLKARVIKTDAELGLALLEPSISIQASPLPISCQKPLAIGSQVSTWGFPGGYFGVQPMLSVGYLAAMDAFHIGARLVKKWVVNAAFNSGNSGGPLLLVETGEVIGVVTSKLAPISQSTRNILDHLRNQQSGMMAVVRRPDGSHFQVSEAQLVAAVMEELRQQVQLVIGYAVLLEDVHSFLADTGAA